MPSWVYAIIEKESNEYIYVGSTTGKYFCIRKGEHTRPSTTTRGKQPKLYGYIKEQNGWDKFKFDILFETENIEKDELKNIEKQHIKEKTPKCNTISPIETYHELLIRKRIASQNFRKNHPDYLKIQKERQSQKDYTKKRCSTKIECPCGGIYTLQNKTNHFSRTIHKKYGADQIKIENCETIASEGQEV